MKKLYLVYGNTWFGGYGEEIHIFGVFSSRKMAEKVKKQAEDNTSNKINNLGLQNSTIDLKSSFIS